MKDDDIRIRPGRMRSRGFERARPFVAEALAAAQRAGGNASRRGRILSPRASTFGRGGSASLRANRLQTNRSRGVVVKARVVRQFRSAAPLAAHLKYLRREGVTRDGEKTRMFGPETEESKMSYEYDAIVIGASHSGLIAQAYLARAGMSSISLDSAKEAGGGLSTVDDRDDAETLRKWRERFMPIVHDILRIETQSTLVPVERRRQMLEQTTDGRLLPEVSGMSPFEFYQWDA